MDITRFLSRVNWEFGLEIIYFPRLLVYYVNQERFCSNEKSDINIFKAIKYLNSDSSIQKSAARNWNKTNTGMPCPRDPLRLLQIFFAREFSVTKVTKIYFQGRHWNYKVFMAIRKIQELVNTIPNQSNCQSLSLKWLCPLTMVLNI